MSASTRAVFRWAVKGGAHGFVWLYGSERQTHSQTTWAFFSSSPPLFFYVQSPLFKTLSGGAVSIIIYVARE